MVINIFLLLIPESNGIIKIFIKNLQGGLFFTAGKKK